MGVSCPQVEGKVEVEGVSMCWGWDGVGGQLFGSFSARPPPGIICFTFRDLSVVEN